MNERRKKNIGTLPLNINFAKQFSYAELEENVRQKDDPVYAQFLSRARLSTYTLEDIDLLEEHILRDEHGNKYFGRDRVKIALDILKTDPRSVVLLPTNEKVDEFNEGILEEMGIDFQEIIASDVKAMQLKKNRKRKRNTGSKINVKRIAKVCLNISIISIFFPYLCLLVI